MYAVQALEIEVVGEEAGYVLCDEGYGVAAAEDGGEGLVGCQWGLGGCRLSFWLRCDGDGG